MARGKIKWHFPDIGAGQGGGFNDAGIDKFKFKASIWRETAQNSIDQWSGDIKNPCKIIYKLEDYTPANFFVNKDIKKIFTAAQKYDKSTSDKGDGQKFYKAAQKLLNKKKVTALSIQDYNTHGLPKHPHDNSSAYHRLIVSPGTSQQSGMGGGSHGHGQKATFAKSKLRTVFYYSYVEKGIKDLDSKDLFVGKTILNQFEDAEGIEYVPTGFYADIFTNAANKRKMKQFPLTGDNIPENIKRTNPEGPVPNGTDIYILEPLLAPNWQSLAEKEIVNNFFGAIENGFLEIGFKNKGKNLEWITKDNLDMVVMKHNSDAADYLKALRSPVNDKPFKEEINKLGTVKLFISQHEGGNQKIAFMRKPRMVIQTLPRKVLSNFSGVLLVDSDEGNKNLRKAENPRHDKLLKNLMREHFDEHVDFLGDIYNFIDKSIEELKGSTVHEKLDIPGLGNLLPGIRDKDRTGADESDKKENVPTKKILSATVKKASKVKVGKESPKRIRELGEVAEDDEGNSTRIPRSKIWKRIRKSFKEKKGGESGIIPSASVAMRSYLVNIDEGKAKYFVKIKLTKKAQGSLGFTFFGEDNINVNPKIDSIKFMEDSPVTPNCKIKSSSLSFDELQKGDIMKFELTVKDSISAALGVR